MITDGGWGGWCCVGGEEEEEEEDFIYHLFLDNQDRTPRFSFL